MCGERSKPWFVRFDVMLDFYTVDTTFSRRFLVVFSFHDTSHKTYYVALYSLAYVLGTQGT